MNKNFDVFLSYQWDIKPKIESLYKLLTEEYNLKVWMDDHELTPTGNLYDQLATGLNSSKYVLCFITRRYSQSKNCKFEIEYATNIDENNENKIIVIMMEDLKMREIGSVGMIINVKTRINMFQQSKLKNIWSDELFDLILKSIQITTTEQNDSPNCKEPKNLLICQGYRKKVFFALSLFSILILITISVLLIFYYNKKNGQRINDNPKDSISNIVIAGEYRNGISDSKDLKLKLNLTGHTYWVRSLTILQNGNLVTGSYDTTLKIWNPITGAILKNLTGHTGSVWSSTVLQNGNLISGSTDSTIKIWNPTTGELIKTLSDHADSVWSLTVLQNSNFVSSSADKTIKIWNSTTAAVIKTLKGHLSAVLVLTVLQNGNLASGSADQTIIIWNLSTGLLIQTIKVRLGWVYSLTVLQNGNLVSGSAGKIINIWNSSTGALIQNLSGHSNFVLDLTVLQNGNLVSASEDSTIKIWDPKTGALIQTLHGHTSGVRALTVLQNGNLVSGSNDYTVKIWG